MRLYGTIQKVDKEQRLVSGYASTEDVDAHGETVLKSAVEAALDDYLDFANLREMHQLSAVGTTEEATVDDKGLYITAKVVDDAAWKKVTSGVYRGFSIGGKVLARDPKNKKIITKVRLDEISLVDRPSNPETRFDVWKAAGGQVEKSMTGVNLFAHHLKALARLASHAEQEAGSDDESDVAKQLRAWLKSGSAIFRQMSAQEIERFAAQFEEEETGDPVTRATRALGAAEEKLAGLSIDRGADVIMKAFAAKDAEIDRLNKRIEEILAEPLPAKTAGQYGLIAVSKEDDAAGNGTIGKAAPAEQELVAALERMAPDERALLLTKAALMMPRPATMVPVR